MTIDKPEHQWVPSRLGHGLMMCAACKITMMEAAVLDQLYCKGKTMSTQDKIDNNLPIVACQTLAEFIVSAIPRANNVQEAATMLQALAMHRLACCFEHMRDEVLREKAEEEARRGVRP